MALSTSIYAEVTTTFPANVVGSGAITVTKSGGVYTIGYDGTGVPVNSIDNDKLSQVAGARLVGNPTGATADRSEISLGGDLEFSGASLQGAALTGDVTKAAGSTTTTIAVAAVTTAKINDGAVTSVKILDANVTSGKLASDAVTTAKILDANITAAKIAPEAITGAKIADDSIDREHHVAASIDHEHLADDIITGATDRTAFASGDKLLIHEAGVGLRKIDYDDLPAGGGGSAWAVHVLTSSNASWPVPGGTSEMIIEGWGGGGAGAGGGGGTGQGAGGGAGGYFRKFYSGTVDATLNITIGAGGAGAAYLGIGGNGGATSVVGTNLGTLTANGGTGPAAKTSGGREGGAGGTATGGDTNITGQAGAYTHTNSAYVPSGGSSPRGGAGGQSTWGVGGDFPGGGGAGANPGAGSSTTAAGMVIIYTR